MKNVLYKALILIVLFISRTMAYEGFGSQTTGALEDPNYTTYHVTSLADSGAGTLREAVSQDSRLIVFDIGGSITLNSSLLITTSYLTIDGLTAPAPGITIEINSHCAFSIEATGNTGPVHDIIINNLRVKRTGDYNGDIFGLTCYDVEDDFGNPHPSNPEVYNIIIDHCTMIGGGAEGPDFVGKVRNVTFGWNLITHFARAQLIGPSENVGNPAYARHNISIHHNVYTHNNSRQIHPQEYCDLIDFVNNVVYGWGWRASGSPGGMDYGPPHITDYPKMNVVENVYHYVSDCNEYHSPPYADCPEDDSIYWSYMGSPWLDNTEAGAVYYSGNIIPHPEEACGYDANSTSVYHNVGAYSVTTYDADTLGYTVVPLAGTHFKTPEETSMLNEISLAIGGQPPVLLYSPNEIPFSYDPNQITKKALGGIEGYIGSDFLYDLECLEPDGDPYTVTILNPETGMTITRLDTTDTWNIEWTPTMPGLYYIVVEAEDQPEPPKTPLTDQGTIIFNVLSNNLPPELQVRS